MHTKHLIGFTALLLIISGMSSAFAGWTVTSLHFAGSKSFGDGISGGQQVGHSQMGDPGDHASLWTGTAASWVDLHPAGATQSWASAVQGGQQVGEVRNPELFVSTHAALWNGTAESFVDLHPAGAVESSASGVYNGQQFGFANFGSAGRFAGMWSGTAGSWMNLNPAGASGSGISAVGDGQQVGSATFGEDKHIGLWSGTAESFVDITPAVTATYVVVSGVGGGQQVGWYCTPEFAWGHAALWNGTAESFADLHPAGFEYSQAYGASGGKQVGYVQTGYAYSASLWSGTASSWVNLHSLLGPEYQGIGMNSKALGIEVVGDDTWIIGHAYNLADGRMEAILWQYSSVPEPSSILALGSGLIALGGLIRRRKA